MNNFILEQLDRVLYVNTPFTFKDAYKLYSTLTRYAERYERKTFHLLSDLAYVMEHSPNISIAYAIQTVLLDSIHHGRTSFRHETKYHIEKNIYAFYIALNSWDDNFLENIFTNYLYNCESKSTGWLASLKYQYLPRYGL